MTIKELLSDLITKASAATASKSALQAQIVALEAQVTDLTAKLNTVPADVQELFDQLSAKLTDLAG